MSSAANVELAGAFTAELPAGRLWVVDPDASGEYVILGATGRVTVWTWDVLTQEAVVSHGAEIPKLGNSVGHRGANLLGDAKSTSFSVTNATFRLDLSREFFESVVIAERDGVVRIAGPVDDGFRPAWLETRMAPPAAVRVSPYAPPGHLAYVLEAGWAYLGNLTYAEQREGPPRIEEAVAGAAGPLDLSLFGGNLSVEDASGRRAIRLGAWSSGGEHIAAGGAKAAILRKQLAIFEGSVEHAALGLGEKWSAGGKSVRWHLDGVATWREADLSRSDAPARGAVVTARGNGVIQPMPRDPIAVLAPDRYVLSGEWEISVDGRPASGPPQGTSAASALAAGGIAGLAISLSFLSGLPWKLAAALYTRLRRDDILSHPARQRLLEVAGEEPGIHQSEAFRRVGGAWGPFTFHLRVLVNSGHLRVERRGKFSLVYPAHAASAPTPPAHPLSKAVYDLVPESAPGVWVSEIAKELGTSRQLVAYHLRRLQNLGLVQLTPDAGGLRARRREATPAALLVAAAEERKPFLPNS